MNHHVLFVFAELIVLIIHPFLMSLVTLQGSIQRSFAKYFCEWLVDGCQSIPQSLQHPIMWGTISDSGTSLAYLAVGDIVLRNKVFVYDLVAQRICWVNYNCKSSDSSALLIESTSITSRPSRFYAGQCVNSQSTWWTPVTRTPTPTASHSRSLRYGLHNYWLWYSALWL